MALFSGLFEKKQCAFCGGEIGMLGNKKLEDGNMCKKCAAKLSPWFDDRRHSTVAQIGEQLAYREANQQEVNRFQTTRTIGNKTRVYLDEVNRKFMVSKASNVTEDNPDVVDAKDITNVMFDVKETKHQLKQKDKDGKEVPYDPPRYDYAYEFYVNIDVNHPYFNRMRLHVNDRAVWLRYDDVNRRRQGAGFRGVLSSGATVAGGSVSPTGKVNGGGVAGALLNGLMGAAQAQGADVYTPEYQEQLFIAQDICNSLMELRMQALGGTGQAQPFVQQPREEVVVCPYCEAQVTPDANGQCPACMAKLAV